MSSLQVGLLLFGVFFALLIVRVPVAFALACVPVFFIGERLTPFLLLNEMLKSYNSFLLLAIPFFLPADQKAVRGMVVIRHPLVRRHPYTGRKALYAVSGTSYGIEGMTEDDGLTLLRELAAHSTQPKYQHRARYGVGDVVLWDNASVLHSATLTDPVYPRTLLRITTKEAGPTIVQ